MFNKNAFFSADRTRVDYPAYIAPNIDVDFTDQQATQSNVFISSEYTTQPTGYLELSHNAAGNAVVISSEGEFTLDVSGNFTGNIVFDYSISSTQVTANVFNTLGGKLLATNTVTLTGISSSINTQVSDYNSNVTFVVNSNIPGTTQLNYEIVGNVSGYFAESLTGNATLSNGNANVSFAFDQYYDNQNNANVEFNFLLRDPRTNNIVAETGNIIIEQASTDTFFVNEGAAWTATELSNGDRLMTTTSAFNSTVTVGSAADQVLVRRVLVGAGGAGGVGLSYPYIFTSPSQDYIVGGGAGGGGGEVVESNISASTWCESVTGGTGIVRGRAGLGGSCQWVYTFANREDVYTVMENKANSQYSPAVFGSHGGESVIGLITDTSDFDYANVKAKGGATSLDTKYYDFLAEGDLNSSGQYWNAVDSGNVACGAGSGFAANTVNTTVPSTSSDGEGGAAYIITQSTGHHIEGGGGGGITENGEDGSITTGSMPDGGDGIALDITGSLVYYGGGGGAGSRSIPSDQNPTPGSGGAGGGGTGGTTTSNGQAGTDGLGAGGGGGGALFLEESGGSIPAPQQRNGGSGGRGVVILRYPYRYRRLRVY